MRKGLHCLDHPNIITAAFIVLVEDYSHPLWAGPLQVVPLASVARFRRCNAVALLKHGARLQGRLPMPIVGLAVDMLDALNDDAHDDAPVRGARGSTGCRNWPP